MDRVEYRRLGQKAGSLVKNEIKYGRTPALDGTIKCVDCGEIATCYDHRNYYKPLDVEPVCYSCNQQRGTGKNRENLAKAKEILWNKKWI